MKYNIISIDDSRIHYKKQIRARVDSQEVLISSTNAKQANIKKELSKRNLFALGLDSYRVGEIGVWLSVFDCWQWCIDHDEELIVFEDDAIPAENFSEQLYFFKQELPNDYDYLCLWVPPNQHIDYLYDVIFDYSGRPHKQGDDRAADNSIFDFGAKRVAKAYNGYGGVATLYSPKGARILRDRVLEFGIQTTVDCYIYDEAHARRCAGYSPKPKWAKAVTYDWAAQTTIHNTLRVGEHAV